MHALDPSPPFPVAAFSSAPFDRSSQLINFKDMEGDGNDKRVKNWTSAMPDILLKECELRYQRIEGKFTFENTHANKEKAWVEITDVVNRFVCFNIFLIVFLFYFAG